MKTKLLMAALLASAALIAPVQGGNGHHGGGGGNSASVRSAPARGGPASSYRSIGRFSGGPSFRSAPVRSFSGNQMIYSGQRFSSARVYLPGSMQFRSGVANSNLRGSGTGREFTRNNVVRSNNQFANRGNRSLVNQSRNGQIRNGNNLRSDWRNHVVAQHSANWNRNWDRHRDHFYGGHRFVFIDGFWWGFDLGFYPWWGYPYDYYGYYPYGYGYGYPYGYGYGYGYDNGYGYNYDNGAYDNGAYDSGAYENQNGYGQYNSGNYGDQSANSTVAAVQDRLSRKGYYHGQIDGVLGPETRRALVRFQGSHGLRASGELTTETLDALRLRQYASE